MSASGAAAGDGAGDLPVKVTREIAAEAAVWVARLHGPSRSPAMERECRAWQARSAAHRLAFERCTETWMDVPRVTVAGAYASRSQQRTPAPDAPVGWLSGSRRWALAAAAAGLLVGGAALFVHRLDLGAYGTGIGEQQQLVLEDGTRMSLNTDTRVRVELTSTERVVTVQGGEALFEVAKDAARPFVVRVAGSEVVALGTTFAVRFVHGGATADGLAVTLIEGRVTVRASQESRGGLSPGQPVAMSPGERVRLTRAEPAGAGDAAATVDRPSLEQVLAWKRSEAVFDEASLADAVAEMNRYSRTPIVLAGDGSLAQRKVSGLYRTGDNAAFASAVARLHGLVVREQQGRLELAAPP